MNKIKNKCIICKDINPLDSFNLCCGENMCHTCMSETEGKPCPTCGVINHGHHTEEDILRCYTKLAAQGNQLAIDRLPSLINLVDSMSKTSKVKREAIRYAKKSKHGNDSMLGMTRGQLLEMKQKVEQMELEGKKCGEIAEYMKRKVGLSSMNEKTLEKMKADPMRLCFHCGISDPEYTCGRCKSAKFCNRGCQKAGWKEHKKQCNKKSKA